MRCGTPGHPVAGSCWHRLRIPAHQQSNALLRLRNRRTPEWRNEEEYIREFVPGEFGKAELPDIPEGFCYATHVSVTLRIGGQPVGRYRQLMSVCEGEELKRLMAG
jgi:hypothetical protein